ncbi:hypothetical protein [Baekduia sp.]|jgi:hypothetical protein|uniref:hypothetical protein n=1 Tax=Baekduia sp. TaxID=2600305 RepID=UPI002E01D700|nr:hypothetical protein [Baekduia sp.]
MHTHVFRTTRGRSRLATAAALIVCGLLPSTVGAAISPSRLIVPYKSIGPVRLGMTVVAAKSVIPHFKWTHGCRCGGGGDFFADFTGARPNDRVDRVLAEHGKYKLGTGVGLGMSLTEAGKHMPSLRCTGDNKALVGSGYLLVFELRYASGKMQPSACGAHQTTDVISGGRRRCDQWELRFYRQGHLPPTSTVQAVYMERAWLYNGKNYRSNCLTFGCDPKSPRHNAQYNTCIRVTSDTPPTEDQSRS